ncbi:MAG: putative metal-binding motif-containing protein [Alphaproteobacteria bacterium]|nr:putative metal-binding motif-containing protein [Alphaproteobacteria bacterium]
MLLPALVLALGCRTTDDTTTDDSTATVSDADGDSFTVEAGDCDDDDPLINPNADEVCDGVDNNCDGVTDEDAIDRLTLYEDNDGDGYGDAEVRVCEAATGLVEQAGDCNDDDLNAYPGAPDDCAAEDLNCDGAISGDQDGDGYLDALCGGDDCDDSSDAVYPGAPTDCGADHDCDGAQDDDVDGDGFLSASCGGDDCDDADAAAFPGLGGACTAGATCDEISGTAYSGGDGLYTIDPDGAGGVDPFPVLCSFDEGVGWTLALTINSIKSQNHDDFGADYVNVAALAVTPEEASSTAYAQEVQGWLNLNLFEYDVMRLAAYADGARTYMSDDIDRAELRISFGQDGYYLYNDANGYYWCGGTHDYTDNGVGQVNQPSGAPADCKGHGSLGSGWDFSEAGYDGGYNQGLTNCGADYSFWMHSAYGAGMVFYPSPGAAQSIWVR